MHRHTLTHKYTTLTHTNTHSHSHRETHIDKIKQSNGCWDSARFFLSFILLWIIIVYWRGVCAWLWHMTCGPYGDQATPGSVLTFHVYLGSGDGTRDGTRAVSLHRKCLDSFHHAPFSPFLLHGSQGQGNSLTTPAKLIYILPHRLAQG